MIERVQSCGRPGSTLRGNPWKSRLDQIVIVESSLLYSNLIFISFMLTFLLISSSSTLHLSSLLFSSSRYQTNHDCPIIEEYAGSVATQIEKITLRSEEFLSGGMAGFSGKYFIFRNMNTGKLEQLTKLILLNTRMFSITFPEQKKS